MVKLLNYSRHVAFRPLTRVALQIFVTGFVIFAVAFAVLAQGSPPGVLSPRSDEMKRGRSFGGWSAASAVRADGERNFTIFKTADTSRSDPLFAGLAMRCDLNGKVDMLVVLIEPFPPRKHPEVTVSYGTKKFQFRSDVATGGAALIVGEGAPVLLEKALQTEPLIRVMVSDGDRSIEGTMLLDGFSAAYAGLLVRCQR